MKKNTPVKSQRQAIINHLIEKGSINAWEAMKLYGIMRLAPIICQLRKEGEAIDGKDVEFKTRYGNQGSYTNYIYDQAKAPPVQAAIR